MNIVIVLVVVAVVGIIAYFATRKPKEAPSVDMLVRETLAESEEPTTTEEVEELLIESGFEEEPVVIPPELVPEVAPIVIPGELVTAEPTVVTPTVRVQSAEQVAARIVSDIVEDAAKAQLGVPPIDEVSPGDADAAGAARDTILAGDYRTDAEGDFVGSTHRTGESTSDFFDRQRRENEAARIEKMSTDPWYKKKWGL